MAVVGDVVTEADALASNAAAYPDHLALVFGDERVSYGTLDLRATQIANGLGCLGFKAGARVAVLSRNSATYFELLFGINRAGMTILPVNWRLALPEMVYILKDAEIGCLFYEADFADVVAVAARECPELTKTIAIEGEGAESLVTWRENQSLERPSVATRPEDIMIQFYTSGTTGDPKGVQISHRSSRIMREMEVSPGGEWLQWDSSDVAIVALPNFHLSGTSWALQWLARGATCVVQPQVDPGAFLKAIEEHRVTRLMAIPTVVQMMLDHPELPATDTSALRTIFYGGMPMPAPLLRRARQALKCDFAQIYGMTENNGTVCYLTPADHEAGEALLKSCGRPLPAVSLCIKDQDGRDLTAGQIGEVCIDSPSLMSGYWKQPDLTAASKHGRYYRTGDAGYLDTDGYLYLVDRTTDMIVSGGENIYPAEIERILVEHPGVIELAVVGVPDRRWGEAVKAVVVRRDESLTEAALIAFARAKVADYKLPKAVEFVERLPRNANGKILKRQLRANAPER